MTSIIDMLVDHPCPISLARAPPRARGDRYTVNASAEAGHLMDQAADSPPQSAETAS